MSEHDLDTRAAFAAAMLFDDALSIDARAVAQADALPPVGGPLDALLLLAGPGLVVCAEPVRAGDVEGPWRCFSVNDGDAAVALPVRST